MNSLAVFGATVATDNNDDDCGCLSFVEFSVCCCV